MKIGRALLSLGLLITTNIFLTGCNEDSVTVSCTRTITTDSSSVSETLAVTFDKNISKIIGSSNADSIKPGLLSSVAGSSSIASAVQAHANSKLDSSTSAFDRYTCWVSK